MIRLSQAFMSLVIIIFVCDDFQSVLRSLGTLFINITINQACPGLNTNEIQIPHDNHHKVSSLVKRRQSTYNYVKYEVI